MKIQSSDLILLEIIYEYKNICGYDISQVIKKRGYEKWAGVGVTSVYRNLAKLEKARLVSSHLDTKKKGKGALPTNYKLLKQGEKILKEEVKIALAKSHAWDVKFDIGLAGIPVITKKQVEKALEERGKMLKEMLEEAKVEFKKQGGEKMPFHVKKLFKHSMAMIKGEVRFVEQTLKEINSA